MFYYCVSDGDKFIGKKVLVVGGRNTGAITAIYLKNLGCNVEIIEKDNQLNAKEKYQDKIKQAGIPYRINSQIFSLEGKDKIEKVLIRNKEGLEEISAEGIFLCTGLVPNNDLAKKLGINLTEEGYISVNQNMATNMHGVYVAGDLTGNVKQIVVAASQGAIAEYNINKILKEKWKRE